MAVAGAITQVLKYPLDAPHAHGLVPLFDSDGEDNIPTWYSSLALLACSLLLCARAISARKADELYARHWAGLAVAFFLAALDESMQFHEWLNAHLASLLGVDEGALPWIVPGAIVVLGLAIAYRPFLLHLPDDVRWLMLLAGVVFVGGALGLEAVEAGVSAFDGEPARFADGMVSTVQELCEILGVVLFLEAVVLDMSTTSGSRREPRVQAAGD